MNLKIKKIIAKEFLILIAFALIIGLTFIGTYPYNYIIKSKIDTLEKEGKYLRDSIDLLLNSFESRIDKQKWLFDELTKLDAKGNFSTYKVLWKKLNNAYINAIA